MRLWLFSVIAIGFCWMMGQTAKKHFGLEDGCVKKNMYMHESACPGPYRIYFAFHRVIFDCIKVRTKCPRIYKYNEYNTLKECQTDCALLMVPVIKNDDVTESEPETKKPEDNGDP
ncbi:uncharacterized protein [Drosophila pseudoobscura]|uniref:Pancreatic trypsin inhibitor n=1 Tax=Drosophila pseudoobscura pseudoobscura TaxID=46245 RepID=A0A0R3NSK3_DROPS|nr:uncharacterized protein LOC26533557 [Drosophila pseudoobscura]